MHLKKLFHLHNKPVQIPEGNQVLILLFSVFLLSSCAGNRRAMDQLEKKLKNSPVFEHGYTGLAVYDPTAEKMLLEHNLEKFFTPASNIKLLTYYAARKNLGDSIAGLEYSISNDSLIFSGTGDPSFLNPETPSSEVFNFLKNAPQKLFYEPSAYSESGLGPGWAWDDYNYSFSAEKSEFPVYENVVRFEFIPGREKPVVTPAFFSDSLIARKDTLEYRHVKRDLHRNIFYYSNAKRDKNFKQKVPFITSTNLTVQLLQDTLQRQVELLQSPFKAETDKVLLSIPADSLYRQMLIESDNFVAEQLLLQISGKLSDSLSTSPAIEAAKKDLFKDLPRKPVWVDGSGLSRYNLLSPEVMVHILEKLKNEVPYSILFEDLPQGGKTGTLKNQFLAEEPFVFAKTGSMSNNYSLSGFLKTESGKILIFSFMNSNYVVPSAIVKAEVEHILRLIKNSY